MPEARALQPPPEDAASEERVLVLTAAPGDTETLCRVLGEAGLATAACPDVPCLCREVEKGGGAAIIAAEVLTPAAQALLGQTLLGQPPWSDFPLIFMGIAGQTRYPRGQLLNEVAGCAHAIMLQRPVHKFTLLSTVRAVLQTRRRQYQVRDELLRRQRAEAALRQSDARFRQLADAMPQLVWTANLEGHVDYINRRIDHFRAIECGADGSWSWQELLAPEDKARSAQAWETAWRSGQFYQIEHRLRMADGSTRWHLSRSLPLRDEEGRISRWFGTATDIHDLKLAEQALDESNRRKDEFLATLAHELRNPLAPIRNAAEVIKLRSPPDPMLQSARSTIDRQLQHMVRLIDDLLDVSRITRGALPLRMERVTLAAVLEQALEASRPHVEAGGHQLAVSLPEPDLYLKADPVRLTQVFLNLINNACKYTPQGGRIALRAEADGRDVLIEVSDTGIGIARNDLAGVFEMFTQGPSAAGDSSEGLGIGLALARSVVEMHGGSISAHSAGSGKGSEFRVRLPLLREAPDAQTAADEQAGSTRVDCARRVLVADDNREIVDTMAMVLRLNGHEVVTACDGLEAVATAERCRPEVVLLDIGMPQLDGYDACRRIRERPWARNISIIALTGWGRDEDRRKVSKAGFDAHLVKPVDLNTLLNLVAGPREAGVS